MFDLLCCASLTLRVYLQSNIGSPDTKCMERCAGRYIDATKAIMKVLQGGK